MVEESARATVWVNERLCKGTEGCDICVYVCPEDVLGASDALSRRGVHPAVVLHLDRCTGCELCMLYCPDLAITVERAEGGNRG